MYVSGCTGTAVNIKSVRLGRMDQVQGLPNAGTPEFQAQKKIKNNFPVTVGETFNRFADFGLCELHKNAFGGPQIFDLS